MARLTPFTKTLRYLERLSKSSCLRADAQADVNFMLGLHESGEYRLDRWSPVVLLYPFLVNPCSPAGMVLRSMLDGYTGAMFQRLASEDVALLRGDGVEVGEHTLPYLFEHGAVRRASDYLREPLSSGDLLNALMIYPMNPSESPGDAASERKIFQLLKKRQAVSICGNHTEIAMFFEDLKIDPSTVAMRLRGYSLPEHDPDNVSRRYSLGLQVLQNGRLKVQIIERWGKHSIVETDKVTLAPCGLWLPESVLFLPQEIEEFESLINAKPALPEQAFQEFFQKHPKWLYLLGEQYEAYLPQIKMPPLQLRHELALIDSPVDGQELRPDFFLKRIGLDLWDVLDIKPADRRIVVGRNTRRKFSEAVAEAVAQLREYSRRLQQNEVRAHLKKKHGLSISSPVAMVLVGRDFDFRTLQEKSILGASHRVRVFTYDDLHRLAKHRAMAL